jgi:hypothetical protein
MITDDQIRANRERIAAKKSVAEESRTLFGYPVVEGILSDYQTTSVARLQLKAILMMVNGILKSLNLLT